MDINKIAETIEGWANALTKEEQKVVSEGGEDISVAHQGQNSKFQDNWPTGVWKEKMAAELVKMAKSLMAGCEKLPEGPMRDNCEKKKKESSLDEVAQDLVKMAEELIAGCEKLPEGSMRDNCEKKKGEKKAFGRRRLTAMRYTQFKKKLDNVYSEARKMLANAPEGNQRLSDDAFNRIGRKEFGTAWQSVSEALYETDSYDAFVE